MTLTPEETLKIEAAAENSAPSYDLELCILEDDLESASQACFDEFVKGAEFGFKLAEARLKAAEDALNWFSINAYDVRDAKRARAYFEKHGVKK